MKKMKKKLIIKSDVKIDARKVYLFQQKKINKYMHNLKP